MKVDECTSHPLFGMSLGMRRAPFYVARRQFVQ